MRNGSLNSTRNIYTYIEGVFKGMVRIYFIYNTRSFLVIVRLLIGKPLFQSSSTPRLIQKELPCLLGHMGFQRCAVLWFLSAE
jgi:hypothetical protein